MKYNIPETTGAMSLCQKYLVSIGEVDSNDKFTRLESYLLYWPDCCGMEGALIELIESLNVRLVNRHLDSLKWVYRMYDPLQDKDFKTIAVAGMYAITERIQPKKHTIVIDGEVYKVDAEKLVSFLKSLE